MFLSFILLSFLIMAFTIQVKINGCTCEEVPQQIECDEYIPREELLCDWNEEKDICESYSKIECSLILGSEQCRVQTHCGWVNGKCEKFQQCSDYKETVDQKCNNINFTCILVKDDQCGRETVPKCESLTPETCYNTSQGLCVLSGNPAQCVTMISCEQGSYNSAQCKKNFPSCIWEDDKCRDRKCTDIDKKYNCNYVFSFDWEMATLCNWTAEGKCIDEKEDNQTEENCFQNSAFGRVWKDGKCQPCSASPQPDPPQPDPPTPIPSYHTTPSIIIFIIAIIII